MAEKFCEIDYKLVDKIYRYEELFLATWIFSLLDVVTCLAFDRRLVSESNYELLEGKPNSSVDCLGSCSRVASLDMRSFCIMMILPLILDLEFLCFCMLF